jgi:hypothetical protein
VGYDGGLLRPGEVQVRFFPFFSFIYFCFVFLFVEFKFEINSAMQVFVNTIHLEITSQVIILLETYYFDCSYNDRFTIHYNSNR